jgi:hypothetical protein
MKNPKKAAIFNPKKACKNNLVQAQPVTELNTGLEARTFLPLGKRILFIGEKDLQLWSQKNSKPVQTKSFKN